MNLSDHDLRQLDEPYIESLTYDQLRLLSLKLLDDLKVARDRLNQTPQNSSMPSGSQTPWAGSAGTSDDHETDEDQVPPNPPPKKSSQSDQSDPPDGSHKNDTDENGTESSTSSEEPNKNHRKPGKQPGAPGIGRKVELPLTGDPEIHRASHCSGCGLELDGNAPFKGSTGLYVVDLEMNPGGMLGLRLTHIKHIYGDTECICGHMTRTEPGRCDPEPLWNVALTEWHLVGPMLVSFIVCLAFRMRLSRPRIKELLNDWLGLHLSVGTINKCVHESGRAVEPIEDEMVEEINRSGMLHGDETPWKEKAQLLWLWVFSVATVTLYLVGYRTSEIIGNVLDKSFDGWIMSDGYQVYRNFKKRLRCWAHLLRKARGLKDSLNKDAQAFGNETLKILETLMNAIYQAREGPEEDLVEKYRDLLEEFRKLCERQKGSAHEKTHALAVEFLNDWEAIFRILSNPHWPLTNNEAERALRHWVILRKLSYGTRTEQGSRAFALLASVIETCRKRGVSPWLYLASVIEKRRKGQPAPRLPEPVVA